MKNRSDNKEKSFDAVKTMREIRDQLSKEIMNMTFAEEKAYLKKLLAMKAGKASQKLLCRPDQHFFVARAAQQPTKR